MKTSSPLICLASILLLTVLACGPFTTRLVTVTAPLATEKPPAASPTAVPTEAYTAVEAPTGTAEEPTQPMPTFPAPILVPQPAAAAHFRPGDPIQIDLIRMISRSEGWGISGPYVLTTADGGQTWREGTPPDAALAGPQAKAYGAFLDSQIAWVVFATEDHVPPEASVWHTTDGGDTWIPGRPLFHEAFGDSVWPEFATLDAQNVWLMIRGVYVGAGTHYDTQFFHTSDGGLTWNPQPGDVGIDYTGLAFADADNGWLTWQTTGAYSSAPPDYAVTFDGGLSWDARELPPPPDVPDLFDQYPYCECYQPILLSARSVRLLVGCFDYHYPPQQFVSYFYASQDGGATWRTVRLPDKVWAAQDSLLYFGLNNALLLGRDMYLSSSDGQTWTFIKTVNWDGQFSFINPQYGWAVARADGEVALVRTTDWARTWAEIKPTIAK